MKKSFIKDAFGWGIALWLIGYLLGVFLFFAVPKNLIGWIIMPIGVLISWKILSRNIAIGSFLYYLHLAFVWTIIAIAFDYVFNVIFFNIGGSYYKLDVYVYYLITFLLPLAYFLLQKGSRLTSTRDLKS